MCSSASRGIELTAEPIASAGLGNGAKIALLVMAGFVIRLYLALTSYCISGDGAAYIRLAQDYAQGNWRKPLGAVFSPLYPCLIAIAHLAVPNWEMAGNLVSVLLGTAAIASVYLLMREAFYRDEIALGAAALTAIHPDLAAYSASVRTEAGYIFLTTMAAWALLEAIRTARLSSSALSGVMAGIAYLYRTEAVGLILLCGFFPIAIAILWRSLSWRSALGLSAAFFPCAGFFVLPYLFFLHETTGHWTVGRELTAAMMFAMSNSSGNTAEMRRLGFAAGISPWAALNGHLGQYLTKVRTDFGLSFYEFFRACGFVVFTLLLGGLYLRGRKIYQRPAEAFLAMVVIFYFVGFALSYTGARFMAHLIPYTFGWVILGLAGLTSAIQRRIAMATAIPAVIAALILLPQTLWPIGYDMRGVRYAGEKIAAHNPSHQSVAARDGRVAWYADAPFVALPEDYRTNLCAWLTQNHAGFMLIGERDERRFGVTQSSSCLEFETRYPRYGSGFYDLYAVRGGSR